MKHTYLVTGMSCNGCRTRVEKALNTVDGASVNVTLDPPLATVTADKEIELLKQQLANLQQEKKALMQVLLTGKKRVTLND